MSGRVFRRDGKKWAYVVNAGIDPVTGKRKQQTKSGFATRKEAEHALREILNSIVQGTNVSRSAVTVSEFLSEWLANAKPRLRETTWYSYSVVVKRIAAEIGAVKLQTLTPLQVESLYSALADHGGRNGRPLDPKTVRNCHTVLHRALSDAERLGIVPRNAAHAARAPVGRRKEMMIWTADQLASFLDFVSSDRLVAAYVLLGTTGMRRGEVLGLRWSDVDLRSKRLSITQTLTTINNKVFLGPTKTPRSRRAIALDAETTTVLKRHRKRQQEERLATGQGREKSGALVFCELDGSPLHPDRFTDEFQRRVRDSGLPDLRGPHSLRHTWATLALASGIHPKVVSDRLGHSTIAVTIDTYSHVSPSLDAGAAETVAAQIFCGKLT